MRTRVLFGGMAIAFLCGWFFTSAAVAQKRTAFDNGEPTEHVAWNDTSGNIINAHDGGILWADGEYHWYGMALRPLPVAKGPNGGQQTTLGVVMYSSKDLYNWHYDGVVLGCSTDKTSPLYCPMRFERPKILYNARTHKYVMWFHYVGYPGDHTNVPGGGEAGVAVSDRINGPYVFKGDSRPIDARGIVRDSTVFQDDDGSAYFIYDRDVREPGPDFGRVLHIVKLTDDYLGFTDKWAKIANAVAREAPVLMKRNGEYFMVTSAETGWKDNAANYYRAKNLMGPWEEMPNPTSGPYADVTYHSQGTWAFAVHGHMNEVIFMAERHVTEKMTDCSYIFLPVKFGAGETISLPYVKEWRWEDWGK